MNRLSESRFDTRQKWLALAGVVLVIGIVSLVMTLRDPPPPPAVSLHFLGFTNSSGNAEALFTLNEPLPDAAIEIYSVRSRNSTGPNSLERGNFSWARGDGSSLTLGVTVDTTNEPLRVVFRFQRRNVGLRRLIDLVRERLAKLRGRDLELFTGSAFYVTNETRVIDATK